jgi:PilZ domain
VGVFVSRGIGIIVSRPGLTTSPTPVGAEPLNGTIVERRLHTRHRARTIVYIILPAGGRRLCKAVNLSATGVFIRTSSLGLRKGQKVELAFAINLGSITKLHRRTAVVAHVSGGGTGLMMEAYAAR